MIVRRKLTSVSSLGLIFFASGKYISSSSSSSAQLHRIFHHRVHLNEQRLGAFEEEGGVEAVGGAHEEDVGLPEQVVAVAADVDQAAVGSRVVETPAGEVERVLHIGHFFKFTSSLFVNFYRLRANRVVNWFSRLAALHLGRLLWTGGVSQVDFLQFKRATIKELEAGFERMIPHPRPPCSFPQSTSPPPFSTRNPQAWRGFMVLLLVFP